MNLIHPNTRRLTVPALWVCLGLSASAPLLQASSINYGNFGPVAPGVQFVQVIESSGTDPVPLYGAPTSFDTGLDFDPVGFTAASGGGGADLTDGQMNFSIKSSPGLGITTLSLYESGNFTLLGAGTASTQAGIGAIMKITVTQIDGVDVAPFDFTPINGSIGLSLPSNPGVVQPWSLGLSYSIGAQLAPGQLATGIEVVINNTLVTVSEAATVSLLNKTEFRLSVGTVGVAVPESDATMLVLGTLTAGAMGWRRRARA